MKTEVDIQKILSAKEVLNQFNRLELRDVTLIDNGVAVEVDPDVLAEFRFTGLNNADFVLMETYKEKSVETAFGTSAP